MQLHEFILKLARTEQVHVTPMRYHRSIMTIRARTQLQRRNPQKLTIIERPRTYIPAQTAHRMLSKHSHRCAFGCVFRIESYLISLS